MPIMKCKDCGSNHYIDNVSFPVVEKVMDTHKCPLCGGKTRELTHRESLENDRELLEKLDGVVFERGRKMLRPIKVETYGENGAVLNIMKGLFHSWTQDFQQVGEISKGGPAAIIERLLDNEVVTIPLDTEHKLTFMTSHDMECNRCGEIIVQATFMEHVLEQCKEKECIHGITYEYECSDCPQTALEKPLEKCLHYRINAEEKCHDCGEPGTSEEHKRVCHRCGDLIPAWQFDEHSMGCPDKSLKIPPTPEPSEGEPLKKGNSEEFVAHPIDEDEVRSVVADAVPGAKELEKKMEANMNQPSDLRLD